ncbi:MAG: thiamine-phosphate kinase [Alphaproteobacteria bacterium]
MNEDAIIARYFRPLAADFPGAAALRDDAATLAVPPGCELAITTDALIANVHFFADDAPADIAFKALAVNISDLAAKAAEPLAYSLALMLPRGTSESWLAAFASGLREAQTHFGIALSGGDTTASPDSPLAIAITAFGTSPAGQMPRRSGASAGESLYVSGTIGDAALGLKLRGNTPEAANWPLSAHERAHLVQRYLRPEPRLALREALRAHATAAMDISDGLAIDCARLCTASDVTGEVNASRVPLSSPARTALEAAPALMETILTGGDDYEILASIRAGEENAFEAKARTAGVAVTCVGKLTQRIENESPLCIICADGTPLALKHSGYDHFIA